MRKWYIILMTVIVVCCCNREVELEPEQTDPEGRVEVSFKVVGSQQPTKALGESPELETVNIAIFGGSGYLKEYQTVIPTRIEDYQYSEDLSLPQYTCTFTLPLTNSSRRVHIIGNGPSTIPFGRDNEVLPTLLTETGKTGFWQMVTLDNVTALQDGDGDYVYPDINRKRQDGEPYVPTQGLKDAFNNVALIRNWAKIELSAADDSNFTPISFAVVNVPSKGTLVPYGGVKGFIPNYKELSFDDLRKPEYDYAGNLPSSVSFDSFIPSDTDFKEYKEGVKKYVPKPWKDEEDYTVYLYERPVPDGTIPPTYVIVYGLYKNADDSSVPSEGVLCYYKVDLMSGSEYYPILRNFKYQIHIAKISAKGHSTPAEAAAAAGSADVSADVNASHLPDISDGTRRMAIQPWMSKTFIKAQPKEERLYVTFYDNINDTYPAPNMKKECVTYELIPKTGGIIKEVEIGDPVDYDPQTEPKPENYGWRPISFAIASPEEAHIRTQTLRILCKTKPADVDESPLYRDIVISLLPTQQLRVSCGGNGKVLRTQGSDVKVDVAIPDGLVESMFPLAFIIEAKDRSLTPDNSRQGNVMPVISGVSLIDENKHTFYFQRTVTWSEYQTLPSQLDFEDESRWRTFSSYFKTNCDESATSIYVGNVFFETNHTYFTNYESFSNPHFTTSIPYTKDSPVSVSVSMMLKRDSYDDTVLLELKNLKPSDDSWLPEASGKYAFHPSNKDMSFDFLTTENGGDISVTFTTDSGIYEPITLVPWHFTNVSFVDAMIMPSQSNKASNVAFGHVNSDKNSKTVLFGYSTDLGNPTPMVRMIIPNPDGSGMKYPSNYTSAAGLDLSKSTMHGGTYTGESNYYWAEMNTNANNKNTNKVSFVLSSVGYVEENVEVGRFDGNVFTWDYNAETLKKNFSPTKLWYELDKTEVSWKRYLKLSFDAISEVGDYGIKLAKGGTYELTANVYNTKGDIASGTDTDLFCVILEYGLDSGGIPLRPVSVLEPMLPEESLYYPYLGNDNRYLWTFPRTTREATLRLKAPNNRDIVIQRIIGKAFRGTLYDTEGNPE